MTARVLKKEIRDVVVAFSTGPQWRFDRSCPPQGAMRMIIDGDIAAALAPAMRTSAIDLYAGIEAGHPLPRQACAVWAAA